jgi:hypothetical protein
MATMLRASSPGSKDGGSGVGPDPPAGGDKQPIALAPANQEKSNVWQGSDFVSALKQDGTAY